MPATFEAFFYQSASAPYVVNWARVVHADFPKRYGLDARSLPLLVYDEKEGEEGLEGFCSLSLTG